MKNELSLIAKAVREGLGAALALSLVMVPLAAVAQDQDPDVGEEETYLEEVIVTGSRLSDNPNLAAATPVLSVSGDEAAIRGNVRIEDFVNILPQVFAAQAGEVSNGAVGTAQLDLRGLNPIRTLVLVDGFRLPYGSSQSSPANVDVIPMQLVERVDILTGGASAVYGSDAIGGVANFILKRDFEGLEFGYQWGAQYNDNDDNFWASVLEAGSQPVPGSKTDGKEHNVYMILGMNTADGLGNATVFASYEDRDDIPQANRVFSGCALGQDDGPESFGGYGCVGSSNFRRFFGPLGSAFQLDDGTIVPYSGGPSQTFNFGPFNFFQRPSERYQIYAKSHYEFADGHEAFLDVSYVNNYSDAQIAPTASFGSSSYSINCDNPYIQTPGVNLATDIFGCTPEDIANGTIISNLGASHRNVEGGPRNSRLENSALRIIAGVRGRFANDVWGYEVFAQTSETRDQSESTNDFVIDNLDEAFLAVQDAEGNVVCLNPAAAANGCVPYNPFQRINGETAVTAEQIAWLHGIGLVNGSTSQRVYGANVQADLGEYGWKLPWADYGIRFLAGLEYRKDELSARPDEISQQPDGGFTGVGGPTLPVAGQVEVDEFYTEFEMPLITQVTGIQELTLRGQYRYSDYSRAGNDTQSDVDTDTWGVSLAWAPVDDLRFRTQFQRSVRAPNVIELYTGQGTNLPNLNPAGTNANGVQLFDPCASDAPIASLAACQNTGVTSAQYGSIFDVISGQTQSLTGGNPFLDPESADTYTIGLVWTPERARGLSVSVDYFDITVEDAIQAGISAQTTLDNCLATGDPTFCGLITRNPFNGSLASGSPGVGFQQTNINIAELGTKGVDFQVVYDFDFGDHSFRVDYASTWLDSLNFVPFPGADTVECAGFFGNNCAGTLAPVNPEYRHRAVLSWFSPWSVDVNLTWRYFGSTDNDNPNEELETKLGTVNYLDLAAVWQVNDNIQLRGTVLNLLGEDPPIFSGAGPSLGNGNTYPTTYDTGTTMYFGVRLNY
jgi:outer membrane receptor protein involved in Fe transport